MEGRHDGDAMEIDPVTAGADDAGFAAQEEAGATLPRPMMTAGRASAISCKSQMLPQKCPSSMVGVRLPRGRHFTMLSRRHGRG